MGGWNGGGQWEHGYEDTCVGGVWVRSSELPMISDNIVDFSEVSLGGMLLDFAAIVGDSLVYYAEQQFNELDYTTATDVNNIVKHMQRANIKLNTPRDTRDVGLDAGGVVGG